MNKAILAALLTWTATALAAPPPTPPPALTQPPPPPGSPRVWPGSGSLGLRAGWGGGTASGGVEFGNVGVKYLLTNHIGLTFALGLGLTASNAGGGASFALDGGAMFYLREAGVALRPYIPLLLGLGIVSGNPTAIDRAGYGTFQFAFAGGLGAEYWFSSYFSVAGELLLRLQLRNFDPVVVTLGTLAPGIHASFYF